MIRKTLKDILQHDDHTQYNSIYYYPIILALFWVPNSVGMILTVIYGESKDFTQTCLHMAFSRLQGAMNAIVYGKIHYKTLKSDDLRDNTLFGSDKGSSDRMTRATFELSTDPND